MAAIDDLKESRTELTARIGELQTDKQRLQEQRDILAAQYVEKIAAVDAKIARVRAQRDSVVLAIRDLTDNWNPV